MIENKRILVIDCNASGIAGDMLLGALLDLGANVERVISAIKTLEAPEYGYRHIDIAIDEVMRGEFRATQIDVTSTAAEKRHGSELIDIVEKATNNIYMSPKAREFASKAIRSLIQARENQQILPVAVYQSVGRANVRHDNHSYPADSRL